MSSQSSSIMSQTPTAKQPFPEGAKPWRVSYSFIQANQAKYMNLSHDIYFRALNEKFQDGGLWYYYDLDSCRIVLIDALNIHYELWTDGKFRVTTS